MNRKWMVMVVALITISSLASVAQAQSNLRLRVNVPFKFVADNTAMQAGEYEISELRPSILVLRNLDQRSAVVQRTGSSRPEKSLDGQAALIFHRYGESYFLTQVVTETADSAYQLETSGEEKQLAQSASPQLRVVRVGGDQASGK
ncbi:MAG TPA: hypothetical protein VEG30_02770 [Terriglobales bacterium]|nr:hypothetical protein [Terriglobales bacterium]